MKNNSSRLEKTAIAVLISTLALSVLMIAAGTPSNPVHRGLNNLLQGATIKEAVYAAGQATTNEDLIQKFLDEAGAENVEAVITDDERNCALWTKGMFGQNKLRPVDETTGTLPQGGCWRSSTPDTIYISSELTNYESLKSVVLHEYAHVLQGRGEVSSELDEIGPHDESNECLADVWAQNNGVNTGSLFYFQQGVCEDYRELLTDEPAKSINR